MIQNQSTKPTLKTGYMKLVTSAERGKWMPFSMVFGGLYQFVRDDHPRRDIWEYGVAAVLLVVCLVQIAVLARLRQSHSTSHAPSSWERQELLIQVTCALGCAFCAWGGSWSLVSCFCGISVFCGISHITRARHRQSYWLLLPLDDNAAPPTSDQPAAWPIWNYLAIDGDGVDIRPYLERPGSPGEEPFCRVLVEYHENQIRVLAWSEGVDIDGDPDIVAVLVADVTKLRLSRPVVDSSTLEKHAKH